MKETNLTSSPRLKGRCCLTDFLYSKSTLLLLIFMLPMAVISQERLTEAEHLKMKEANHQEYLRSHGKEVLLNDQLTDAQIQQQIQEAELLGLRAKLDNAGVEVEELLNAGYTLEQIQSEIENSTWIKNSKGSSNNTSLRTNGGDYCSDPYYLACGESVTSDNYAALASGAPTCVGGNPTDGTGVWYEFTGNGYLNTLSISSTTIAGGAQIRVFTGECGSLNCPALTGQGTNSITFMAAYEINYYVLVSGFATNEGLFTIERSSVGECIDGPAGDGLTAETGFEVACGDVIEASSVEITATEVPSYCGTTAGNNGVWFQYTSQSGDPEDISVLLCDSDFDNSVNVYTGTPGNLNCVGGSSSAGFSQGYPCGGSYSNRAAYDFTAYLGETYYIYVSNGFGSGTGNISLQLVCDGDNATPPPSAPANDLCPDATALNCGETLDGTLVAATNTDQPSTSGCISINTAGVWYTYEGEGNPVIVSTCEFQDNNIDTRLHVFTGSCGSLVCYDSDDDTEYNCSDGLASSISFTADEGEIYYIYVSAYSSSSIEEFQVSLECIEPVTNDDCSSAELVSCGTIVEASLIGATTSTQPYCGSSYYGPGVWYTMIGDGGPVILDTDGSNTDNKLFVFSGDCNALSCEASYTSSSYSSDHTLQFDTVDGEVYYIHVAAGRPTAPLSTFVLDISCPPDPCENATEVYCGDVVYGDSSGANGSYLSPSTACQYDGNTPGLMYKITGTDELITVNTCGSSFDTRLSVYSGACGELQCVGSNDDNNDVCDQTLRSQVNFFGIQGEVYYIWLEGFAGQSGNTQLNITCQQPVGNDTCDAAITLQCGSSVDGSTVLSTSRGAPGEDCTSSSDNIGEGVWYNFLGTGGDVEISLCNTDFDAKLLIGTGGCEGFECFAGSDDDNGCGVSNQPNLVMPTESGVEYTIYVTGDNGTFSGTYTGDFTITVDCYCYNPNEGIISCETIYDGWVDYPGYPTSTTLVPTFLYGEAPITYSWSDGSSASTLTVDAVDGPSANYTVVMTDATGCTASQEWYVHVIDINCDTKGTDKVLVCHNGQTICVAPSAVETHIQHGDVLGTCGTPLCDEALPQCDATLTSPVGLSQLETTLTWTGATGIVTSYNVVVADANGEVVNTDVSGLSLAVSLPEYDTEYCVTITPSNTNGEPVAACQPTCFTTVSDPSTIPCGSVSSFEYCYGNYDDTTFEYTSSDGGPLTVEFNAGTIEGYFDYLRIYDGTDNTGALLYQSSSSFGTISLADVLVTSPNGTLFLEVDSDSSVSCASGQRSTWYWDVYCGYPEIACNTGTLTVLIDTDSYGSETSWDITDASNSTVASGSGYGGNTVNTITVYLSDGNYTFNIYDSWGDGIYSPSGYSVTDSDGVVIASDFTNSWDDSQSTAFCVEGSAFRTAPTKDIVNDWSMAPNPTKGNVTLDLSNYLQSDVTVDVMNINGQVIFNDSLQNLKGSRYEVELNNSLPAGMYFVRVAAQGQVSTKKLMIMR